MMLMLMLQSHRVTDACNLQMVWLNVIDSALKLYDVLLALCVIVVIIVLVLVLILVSVKF